MSSKAGPVKSVRYQLILEPRKESSKDSPLKINKGSGIQVKGVTLAVNIKSTEAGPSAQSWTLNLLGNRVIELLIANDVQMIPVTLQSSSKTKTIEWRAPFVNFPIEVEIEKEGSYLVVIPDESKDATDAKESTKKDEPLSSASSLNTNENNSNKDSLQSKERRFN